MSVFSSYLTAGIFLFHVWAHPMHISVTEIVYDQKEKELEITMRIFAEDLEEAIRDKQKNRNLDILNPPKGTTTDQLIADYLPAHFKISLDNKPQKIQLLGHEEDGEALICYIRVANIKKWKTIDINNNMILEIYDDQSNLVHVTVGETVKSLRFMENTTSGKLSFGSK